MGVSICPAPVYQQVTLLPYRMHLPASSLPGLFPDFAFHTTLIHALRAFFYPAVWLSNLRFSRWPWNCASNTVRRVEVVSTPLKTGPFSTRCRANDAELASLPPLDAWYLLRPSGPGGQTSSVFQEVVPLHPGLTEPCPEAWQPKHSSLSKRNLPLNKSLFCLHSGVAGSCPSRPQLPHGGDPPLRSLAEVLCLLNPMGRGSSWGSAGWWNPVYETAKETLMYRTVLWTL